MALSFKFPNQLACCIYFNVFNISADSELQNLIKGGEACAWSEYIDPTNYLSLVW